MLFWAWLFGFGFVMKRQTTLEACAGYGERGCVARLGA